jgi:hypothetical protein
LGQGPDLHVHGYRDPGPGSQQADPVHRGPAEAEGIRRGASHAGSGAGHRQRSPLNFHRLFILDFKQ